MVGVLKRQVPSCGDLGGSSYDLVEDNTAIPTAKETGFVIAFCKDPWVETGGSEPQVIGQSPWLS